MQLRCNDEFYIVAQSQSRGNYTTRADVVIDCRGFTGKALGIGPGGTFANGQLQCKDRWLRYYPLDDRFEPHRFLETKTLVVGTSLQAQQFISEFRQVEFPGKAHLLWLVRPQEVSFAEAWVNAESHAFASKTPVTVLNGYV